MAIRRQFILATDANRAAVESAIRADRPTFALTQPVYTETDLAPRPISHWVTDFTQTLPLPSIEDPVTGCKVLFPEPGGYFEEHFIPGNMNYVQDRLAALGLRNSPGEA